jgi:hypothetical protein
MTVGKISLTCWIVFTVMCVAFMPLILGISALHALPVAARVALSAFVIAGLWWGTFAYAMYLSMAVIKNGDKRLLKRGVRGSAEVLARKATNQTISSGGAAWQGSRVYKYRLKVSVPGKDPYETDFSICAAGISVGSTVDVAVSPHNRKRVTVDVGQAHKKGAPYPTLSLQDQPVRIQDRFSRIQDGTARIQDGTAPIIAAADRVDVLARLSQLHSQGDLTDAEFAAEKARILRQ